MEMLDLSSVRTYTDEEKNEIWVRFWGGDDSARLELHEAYMPLVAYFVRYYERRISKTADKDGLVSEAFFGLDEAINNYSNFGNRFETFASIRIRGSILDAYRKADWLPRGLRSTWRKCADASDDFLAVHHREPTTKELSDLIGMTEREIIDALVANDNAHATHFDSPVMEFETGEVTLGEVLEDFSSLGSHTTFEIDILMGRLLDSLENELDEFEQLVILWKYIDDTSLVTIAERFDVPVSAVSSIHRRALSKLKASLSVTPS